MARASSVEYSAVAHACYELFQRGESVSFPRVYDLIGNKGSGRVVNDFIKEWRKEAGDKLAVTSARNLPGLPENIVASADDLLVKLWSGALATAEQSYQEAQGELELERTMLHVEHDKEQADRQALLADNARFAGELAAALASLGEQGQALQAAQARGLELEIQLRERDEQVGALREDVARLAVTLDVGSRQHASDLANAQARATARLTEARRLAKQAETKLRNDVAEAVALRDAYQQQAHQAGLDASQWRGRAESAEGILERLADKKPKRRPAQATESPQAVPSSESPEGR